MATVGRKTMGLTHARPRHPRNATEWFVAHESGRELDSVTAIRWRQWFSIAQNRADYAEIQRICSDATSLPPPSNPGRELLLQDVAADTD
jgi:hypothetical protein